MVGDVVNLHQTVTAIGLKDGPKLISLYVEPGTDISSGSQIGLPQLLDSASDDQFTLLKSWIKVCDSDHDICRRKYNLDGFSMPTRLIEVGETVRLILSSSIKPSRYVALSHCWGHLEESQKFCTYQSNIEQLKESIDLKRMPQTFMDAITVTRGLGIKYIWIDSLCIIQDDHADWENEARKMEQVYSAAYCTIGASSAKSSLDGFLAHRPPRSCVQIQTDDMGPLYACQAIDDFHQDVELSELNKRGWVLQERALSRRSIFFSSSQVYWECGTGVHCETLGRLKNSKASFLGDANFPKSALAYYRDGRQVLIQDLYERYSSLAFTKPSDRSVAILGLQNRLERALQIPAAYGFFKDYFARGLLWKRGQEGDMIPIQQQKSNQPPSWSWFSKEGVIEYLNLGFKQIDWATDDFENPFESFVRRDSTAGPNSKDGRISTILRGLGRHIKMSWDDILSDVTFDRKQDQEPDELRCVIIGRDQALGSDQDHRMVHVLIISKCKSIHGNMYERVGVASLMSSLVASQGSWVNIL
ncbi:heterokaryon incompatibility protein [Colletotrichum truncatum]|uniref:Heterokaryon incompatibility protein n=1 Tax=Colletotrichum truncatum TaxID=5467 RepID=A0ACC3YS96_COLTU